MSGTVDPAAPPPGAPPAPRRRARWAALCLLLIPTLVGADALLIEPRWIEVTRHELGEGPRRVTVMHLTDLHLGLGREREVTALQRLVEQESPDLIVVTGDSVVGTRPVTPADAQVVIDGLRALHAPLGVFACPGNHEDWAGPPAYDCYRQAGVPMLRDDATRALLDGRLVLHGVGTPDEQVEPTAGFDVLLCHYPVVLDRLQQWLTHERLELVLAGHTHGGQVRLPCLGALWLPSLCGDYEQGWYERGDTRMCVCRGVGTSILPVRFLCRPEVALITIHLPD